MSLLFGRAQRDSGRTVTVPMREGGNGHVGVVTASKAMRHSAVWAATRLRANLISTLPIDTFRRLDGVQITVPTPQVLVRPGALQVGGPLVDIDEWLYATQVDVDRRGNCFGRIMARDGLGYPSRIDLVDADTVTVRSQKGRVTYWIEGKEYDPFEIWHERQYVVPGSPVGLSPIAHAALAISGYFSAQEFVADWFGAGGKAVAHLKNTAITLNDTQADKVKTRTKAAMQSGDILVTGKDWDYSMVDAKASEAQFIETQSFSVLDTSRFFDVPGDLIDAQGEGSHITYASTTARNLQLLVINLGPAITRREKRLSSLMAAPRFVKLNSDALLRMDPKTAAEVLGIKVEHRATTPDEWRRLDDQPPLSEHDYAQFDRLWPPKAAQPTKPDQGSPS